MNGEALSFTVRLRVNHAALLVRFVRNCYRLVGRAILTTVEDSNAALRRASLLSQTF